MRIAAANATVLLLAATFEEFIRELAREYARFVVTNAPNQEKIPIKLITTVWRRTMEALAKTQIHDDKEKISRDGLLTQAQKKFLNTFEFCRGDLSQDIYSELIHNENNMRPNELNSMFKISGLSNICYEASSISEIQDFFGADNQDTTHVKLIDYLNSFFERRNQIAHSVAMMKSVSPNVIKQDIDLLRRFGKSLSMVVEMTTRPTSPARPIDQVTPASTAP